MATNEPNNAYVDAFDAMRERLDGIDSKLVTDGKRRDTQILWTRLAVLALALVLVGAGLLYQRQQDVEEASRRDKRAAVCSGFEAFTNSFIAISRQPTNEEERVKFQERIDTFKADLEQRLGPLDCTLNLLTVVVVPGVAP